MITENMGNQMVRLLGMMICMVLGGNAIIPCGEVQFKVAPCLGYLRGGGGVPPAACCNSLRALNNETKSGPDRQGVCRCLKSTVFTIPGLNLATVAAVAGKCGVNLPYTISPTLNCNIIH
ncbi:putative plant lipid transfer protein/Par allergen [Lupinus albus]|uniref:Non-specific lipid-transfer protein n=1 Tax=Lupinus albus TaxID=3870 RepID=A0A6A4QVR8_LUPAL|nr:putative plant lipid transfer protein/Par allergen [Lupinus albus]